MDLLNLYVSELPSLNGALPYVLGLVGMAIVLVKLELSK